MITFKIFSLFIPKILKNKKGRQRIIKKKRRTDMEDIKILKKQKMKQSHNKLKNSE